MKKIFILPILIAPIAAMATGPSYESGTPVRATAPAPYTTATIENGDSTTVVSASYVKGAYNDTIAAINRINEDKQDILQNTYYDTEPISEVIAAPDFLYWFSSNGGVNIPSNGEAALVSAAAVATAISAKRVSAVTTWGDDAHPTQLQLTTASN